MADDEIKRNFAAEAVAIASDQSRLLPEVEHLRALAAKMESVLREKQLLSEMLCAAMVDTAQPKLYFPADDLERVRKNALNLVIERVQQTGAFIVKLSQRHQPTPASPTERVN